MTKKKNIPDIRFKGFSEEWEEKKLFEIADIIGGGTPSTSISEYWNGNIDWYSPTEIGKNIYAFNSIKKITALGLEKSSAKVLPSNKTVLFTSRAGIGDMAILKRDGATNQGFQSLVVNDDNNPYFIYSAGHLIKEYALKHSSGSTFLEISGKILGNMDINIPKLPEQTKIGNYFKNLDQLITQHQQKYDKLLTIKKAMLKKMFPQNGANVPEIRFKGFSGEWEEKNITELGKIFIGLVTTMTKYYRREGILLIRNSDIKDNHFEFADEPIFLDEQFAQDNANRKLKIGDVITVHTGDVGTSAVITKKEDGAIGFATIVTRPDKMILNSNYLSTFFNTYTHKSFAINISTGDGRTNYNLGDFFKLNVPLPKIEEQSKISKYFIKIDKLIILQQTKLKKLKNIKKAFLDKMFV